MKIVRVFLKQVLCYRTLKSDDFHILTLQGWDFEKSEFKIKLSKKFDNLNFVCFF